MSQADNVTITTTTEHTTGLVQLTKEYAVLYERFMLLEQDAKSLLEQSEAKADEAGRLRPEVDALRSKVKELIVNG